jgi:hypothetical protein
VLLSFTIYVINVFNHFNDGVAATLDGYAVEKFFSKNAGNINTTYIVKDRSTGEPVWVMRKLNKIFDIEAINKNMQLLQIAQERAQKAGAIPDYWRMISFSGVIGTHNDDTGLADVVYYDEAGEGWQAMKYISGITSYDMYSDVPENIRKELAVSFGEAIATLQIILSFVDEDEWAVPLYQYHDTAHHLYDYLKKILAGEVVKLSLSNDPTNLVKMVDGIMEKYPKRLSALLKDIEEREYLVHSADDAGTGINQNDTKFNNGLCEDGRCVGLIDLDTIQAGNILDDLADALRFAGNPVGEIPDSIDDVYIDVEIVKCIIEGYFNKVAEFYGKNEAMRRAQYTIDSFKRFYYEQCIRWAADTLIGDKYYVLGDQPADTNLYRAEVQMRALKELEKVEAQLRESIPGSSEGESRASSAGNEVDEVLLDPHMPGSPAGDSVFRALQAGKSIAAAA